MFTKNRDRLLTTDMSRKFLAAILAHREVAPLLSDELFTGDVGPIFRAVGVALPPNIAEAPAA